MKLSALLVLGFTQMVLVPCTAVAVAPAPRCSLNLLTNTEVLANLNYNSGLVSRLIAARPDVVNTIVEKAVSGDALAKPVTMFRGLSVEPRQFKAAWKEASQAQGAEQIVSGDIWVSRDVKVAVDYAMTMTAYTETQKLRTIIEYEIPNVLLLDSSGKLNLGRKLGVVKGSAMPDSRPFIKRVGIIDASKYIEQGYHGEVTPENIHWFTYEEIFKDGVPQNPGI